jgi:16S rRNA processing protein RimM
MVCESIRGGGDRWIVRLSGLDNPETARGFGGRGLWAREADLPRSEAKTPYHFELLGLEVVTIGGESIGSVRRIDSTPAGDLLVLDDEGNLLIPFRPMVVSVDRGAGRIVVDIPAGLLEVNRPSGRR